ncbi:hypothetical protein P154DRAFT_523075 [Amniculicola lignicola CBS 123094]|uniref:Uncharacterized protein n=1 Tax=Amniculicola lignicola CBS 123094 TaxID=1392246 RepID=A0A6A5WFQ8_9PLEO|nr:hypothetical protein P154DRAFT_523075 [Amniculicola lignicola CBS 123094]
MADLALFPQPPPLQQNRVTQPAKAVKKLSWAEEKEDEEEWQMMMEREQVQAEQGRDGRILALENEVREKAKRIKELEEHVEELNRKLEATVDCIPVIVSDVAASGTSTTSLESAATAESSVTSKVAESAVYMVSVGGNQAQSIHSKPLSSVTPSPTIPSSPWGKPLRQMPSPPAPKTGLPIDNGKECNAASQAKSIQKKDGPIVRPTPPLASLRVPIHISRESVTAEQSKPPGKNEEPPIRQTAPSKPSHLRLPIDIARERIAAGQAKAAGKKEETLVLVGPAAKGGWSGTAKKRDIRDMSLDERSELFRGPTISIYVGQEVVRAVPKKIFMAASSKANDYFLKYPQLNSLHFKAGEISIPALQRIVEWLTNMGTYGKIYSIPLTDKLPEDVNIMRAARMFAMERYIAHFTRKYCDYVRNSVPTYDNIAAIIKAGTPGDPLLECLANNLAHQRHRGIVQNPESFEKFLGKYPTFKKTLDEIEKKLALNRTPRGTNISYAGNGSTHDFTPVQGGKIVGGAKDGETKGKSIRP